MTPPRDNWLRDYRDGLREAATEFVIDLPWLPAMAFLVPTLAMAATVVVWLMLCGKTWSYMEGTK